MTCLGREVMDNISSVPSPQKTKSFILYCSLKTVSNPFVRFRQPTSLDHFILVLDQKFDSVDWSSCCFRHTTHEKINGKLARPISAGDWTKTGETLDVTEERSYIAQHGYLMGNCKATFV